MAKKPEIKMPKLPKSLGKCVDLYLEYRERRLAEKKVMEASQEVENGIKDHIISTLPKGDTGVAGATHVAKAYNDIVYQVEDWDKLYNHIKKTGDFQLLNRALNQAAVKDIVDQQTRPAGKRGENWKPKLPPGVKTFTVVKLSVTKA